ncbi:hypothetical protein [Microbacterium sp. E-13]|uniref:hypothetical protein n=1 Tax=Microbacterium sp. E-13 TaxID=3404048 RepID=UPI003CE8782B
MAFPPDIPTRQLLVPEAVEIESGRPLRLEATVDSDLSLVWAATGWQFRRVSKNQRGETGTSVSVELPVTDANGWKTDGGALIEVGDGEFSHTYTVTLRYFDQTNKELTGLARTIRNLTLPTDGDPARLDQLTELPTVEGGHVLVPDTWDAKITAAEAAAAAAAANLAEGSTYFATAAQGVKADEALPAAQKGAASGVAPLDSGSRVPAANLPAHLTTTALGATYVDKGKVSVNVRDYGAVGDNVTDDSAAFLAAEAALGAKGGVIRVPQTSAGYYLATPVNFTKRWVRILGEGAEVRGTFIFGKPGNASTTPNPVQHMNGSISGINFVFTGVAADRNAIMFRNCRQFEVTQCQFTNCDKAILLDAGTGAAFHSISSINIHHNQFFTCNYHVKGIDGNAWASAAISDCVIDTNIMNLALIRNVDLQQIDGVHISGNVMFMIGYSNYGSEPNILLKEQNVYVGSSNGLQIHSNQFFEAGYEGVLADNCRGANISGNWIARPGQRDLRSGIKVTGLTNSVIEITNNRPELYTKHGVEILGTTASPATLTGNTGRYDAATPTYWGASEGGAALSSISHGLVAVDAAFTGPVPDTGSHHSVTTGENIRLEQLHAGVRSYQRIGQWAVFANRIVSSATFTTLGTTGVGELRDATMTAANYGGMVLVTAKRSASSSAKTSSYVLLIQGTTVNLVSAAGLTTGAAADDPSFTWSVSSNILRATAVGATSGSFTFEHTTLGNILVV